MNLAECNHRWLTIASAAMVWLMATTGNAAAAEQPRIDVTSESPFGVVCPWPGVSKAGIKWCRVGAGATSLANWPGIEKERGKFDWTDADAELKNFDDPEGLSLLPIFGYTPKWASKQPDAKDAHWYPPRDVRTFSLFVFECVNRYKHRVKVWEVWNEPNIGFFHGSIAEYAELVKAASVAAKKADPTCRIAMGCAGVDVDFLRRLYEFGCGPYFDVMSVHPYQWGLSFNDGWMVNKLEACRDLMDEFGDTHKEIWLTELGWSVSDGVSAQQQANLLAQNLATALTVRERLKVEKIFWFCVKDWGGPGYGLLDVHGKPKPAFTAYTAVTTALEGARYLGRGKNHENVRIHVFERAGKPVVVLWSPSAKAVVPIEFTTQSHRLVIRGVTNETHVLRMADGKVTLKATHAPIFITGLDTSDLAFDEANKKESGTSRVSLETPNNVWVSILPPDTTMRPCFVLDADNQLPIRVHNSSDKRARGELAAELRFEDKQRAEAKWPLDVETGEIETVVWQLHLPPLADGISRLGTLIIRGSAAGEALDSIELPVRLSRSRTIEFLANSHVEREYLHDGGKSGCAESIRFGDEFTYRFDLRDYQEAQLRLLVGANAAQQWHVSLSNDEKTWQEAASGKSWPAWQTLNLNDHLPPPGEGGKTSLFVKIHGDNCQLRELILESE